MSAQKCVYCRQILVFRRYPFIWTRFLLCRCSFLKAMKHLMFIFLYFPVHFPTVNSHTSLIVSQEVLSLLLIKLLPLNYDNIHHFLLWRLEVTYWTQFSKTSSAVWPWATFSEVLQSHCFLLVEAPNFLSYFKILFLKWDISVWSLDTPPIFLDILIRSCWCQQLSWHKFTEEGKSTEQLPLSINMWGSKGKRGCGSSSDLTINLWSG